MKNIFAALAVVVVLMLTGCDPDGSTPGSSEDITDPNAYGVTEFKCISTDYSSDYNPDYSADAWVLDPVFSSHLMPQNQEISFQYNIVIGTGVTELVDLYVELVPKGHAMNNLLFSNGTAIQHLADGINEVTVKSGTIGSPKEEYYLKLMEKDKTDPYAVGSEFHIQSIIFICQPSKYDIKTAIQYLSDPASDESQIKNPALDGGALTSYLEKGGIELALPVFSYTDLAFDANLSGMLDWYNCAGQGCTVGHDAASPMKQNSEIFTFLSFIKDKNGVFCLNNQILYHACMTFDLSAGSTSFIAEDPNGLVEGKDAFLINNAGSGWYIRIKHVFSGSVDFVFLDPATKQELSGGLSMDLSRNEYTVAFTDEAGFSFSPPDKSDPYALTLIANSLGTQATHVLAHELMHRDLGLKDIEAPSSYTEEFQLNRAYGNMMFKAMIIEKEDGSRMLSGTEFAYWPLNVKGSSGSTTEKQWELLH